MLDLQVVNYLPICLTPWKYVTLQSLFFLDDYIHFHTYLKCTYCNEFFTVYVFIMYNILR